MFYFLILIPILSSIVALLPLFLNASISIGIVFFYISTLFFYWLFRKKLDEKILKVLFILFILYTVIFTLFMILFNGNASHPYFSYYQIGLFPFFPMLLFSLLVKPIVLYTICILHILFSFFLSLFFLKKSISFKKILIFMICLCLTVSLNIYLYRNRDEVKYGGHGFQYMNGYSSTDFSDYRIQNPENLVKIDTDFKLSSNYPVLDGAEACYPLYASFALNTYENLLNIEKDNEYNGTYVTFTNTIQAFYRLLNQEVDILFGARPSIEQYEMAKEMNMDLNVVPIGKEAFVFFVQEDNPIDNLTSDQIRSIYHGTITNWKEVGGKDEEIQAFQRPKNSGSQTMMEYFMKDVSLKEAKTYETIAAMEGVISKVAQYNDEKGAMGYSFRYFIEVLQQEKNVKILSVDGIYPSIENIRNGSYPLIVDVCTIYNRSNSNENVNRLMNFILSKEGQAIVEQTGYSPIGG